MSIPNVVRFVWSGQGFPYHARLAVESVLLADPDVRVVIHTFGSTPRAARHWERVLLYDRVQHSHEEPAELFAGLPAPARTFVDLLDAIGSRASGAQSDLIRLAVLHRDGGVSLDVDVLVLRSLKPLLDAPAFVGEELASTVHHSLQAARAGIKRRPGPASLARAVRTLARAALPGLAHTTATGTRRLAARFARRRDPLPGPLGALDRVWGTLELSNAVVGAEPANPWVRRTLMMALEQDPKVPSVFGSTLVNCSWEADPGSVQRLPASAFHSVPRSRSFELFETGSWSLDPGAYVLHYVRESHRNLLDHLDEDRILARRDDATFYRVAADVQVRARDLALGQVPFMPLPGGTR